jgi:hypothetical protein
MSDNPEKGKCKHFDTKFKQCNNYKHLNKPCMTEEKESRCYGMCEEYCYEK